MPAAPLSAQFRRARQFWTDVAPKYSGGAENVTVSSRHDTITPQVNAITKPIPEEENRANGPKAS